MSDLASPSFPYPERRVSYPTASVWLKHIFWFLVTFVTATLTGAVSLFSLEDLLPNIPEPQTWEQGLLIILSIPVLYLQALQNLLTLMSQDPKYLSNGLCYSVSLLFILTCHEFGHYIACRIYRVDASLPYFIPSPPLIAVGTFGAFIRIREPLPSRKAIFDIGVAGPIAGFIAIIPIALIGVSLAQPVPPGVVSQYVFSDPLLMRLIGWMMNVDVANSYTNSFYMTAWLGLLVTSLNLIPAGQLDGGHAVYAIFGKRLHSLIARGAFAVMLVFTVLGFIYYHSPSGILFMVILAIMLRVGHPEPYDDTRLDLKRRVVAALTLLVFILSFVPFPIQINIF
jgi:membrane-associated protease RseP (regulator of RpoE activity)